jgi:hypothetical protein
VRPILDAAAARWELEVERRAADVLQRAIDAMPRPKDGKDGLGFDDLMFQHDGARTATLRFVRGDQVKEFQFRIPALIDCGVWRTGASYEHGDGVTYASSYWISQKDGNTGTPGDDSKSWRLAVKKGRDAKL